MKIGMLKEVDIRDLWKHEQYDFSNWLAEPENIAYLNDILGLTLVDVDKEKYVGSYRCDIVAKDETSDITVIIENQLEASNHDHLGKIITYASGLDAKVVVWIVKQAKEEHRSAVEWLNNNTRSGIDFFLIELHAYKIGDSDPAPKFEVIEQPNDFIKSSKTIGKSESLNKSQAERMAFWEQFNNEVISHGKPFNTRKATTDHWYNVAIGSSACYISITLVNSSSFVGVELTIPDNKDLFDSLYEKKEEIDSKIGFDMEWERLDEKKACKIIHRIPGLDFDNKENYPQLMDEIIKKAIIIRDVFKKYIK